MRRRDRLRQVEELRRSLRLGSAVVAPILFVTAIILAVRFPGRGVQLFAPWAAEALLVGALWPIATRAPRSLVVPLTLALATIPAIGLPITLAVEPGTLLMMNSAFAILPVAVPLFLAWPRTVRTGWVVAYAAVFTGAALLTGYGHLDWSARTDLAVDMAIGCLIGWVGGELLERPRLRTIEHDLEMRWLNRVLRGHATTDPLTTLANRRQLEADLELLAVSVGQSNAPCAILLFDLDHFKRLNDELGHAAGDAALRAVGLELTRFVRGRDTVYRYGGEEFLVILPDTTLDAATEVAERIRRGIEGLRIRSSLASSSTLTISGGVAVASPPHLRWDRVLASADAALYESKAGGRNRVSGPVLATNAESTSAREEGRPMTALVLRPGEGTATS